MFINRYQKQKPGPVILDLLDKSLSQEERELVCHPAVGGVILFTRNYDSPSQLMELIRELRSYAPELLLTVDHEGGRVQRFRHGFTVLPPMAAIGESAKLEQASANSKELGWLMASELLAYDIDLSFAPVLDLDNDRSTIIGNRAFADDPQQAIALAGSFIKGMHEAGMAATGKHFPGHGGVRGDSHLELPVDERPYEQLLQHDLRTFNALASQLDGMMPAHIVFPAVDSLPVGYSSKWLQEELRQKLNFQGVIFSDDLSMEGAANGPYWQRAQSALYAGCDSVLVCNDRAGAIEVVEFVEASRAELALDTKVSLASMRRRKSVSIEQLQLTQRWRRAVALAERLQHG